MSGGVDLQQELLITGLRGWHMASGYEFVVRYAFVDRYGFDVCWPEAFSATGLSLVTGSSGASGHGFAREFLVTGSYVKG